MNEFFGIPMGPLAVALVILVAALLGALGALALRNRIFLRLGVRNVTRRRARTALIVLGLMLGTTIISSALVTGDTMSHTIRSSAVEAPGRDGRARLGQGRGGRSGRPARLDDRSRVLPRGRASRRSVTTSLATRT